MVTPSDFFFNRSYFDDFQSCTSSKKYENWSRDSRGAVLVISVNYAGREMRATRGRGSIGQVTFLDTKHSLVVGPKKEEGDTKKKNIVGTLSVDKGIMLFGWLVRCKGLLNLPCFSEFRKLVETFDRYRRTINCSILLTTVCNCITTAPLFSHIYVKIFMISDQNTGPILII